MLRESLIETFLCANMTQRRIWTSPNINANESIAEMFARIFQCFRNSRQFNYCLAQSSSGKYKTVFTSRVSLFNTLWRLIDSIRFNLIYWRILWIVSCAVKCQVQDNDYAAVSVFGAARKKPNQKTCRKVSFLDIQMSLSCMIWLWRAEFKT